MSLPLIVEIDLDSENSESSDVDQKDKKDKKDQNDITENDYIEMANDFKCRIFSKNSIIQTLQKKLISIYALVDRFMETEDFAFIEETRMILDKVLVDDIGIQDIT